MAGQILTGREDGSDFPGETHPAQVALAWVLKRSPVMLPIPGTSKTSHLEDNVAAASLTLSDDDFHRLDEVGRQEAQRQ